MGQKVNPHGLRVGVIKDWNTTWYADKKEFSKFLKEDNVIRTFLKKKYYAAAISKILIERAAARIVVTIYTARPGIGCINLGGGFCLGTAGGPLLVALVLGHFGHIGTKE